MHEAASQPRNEDDIMRWCHGSGSARLCGDRHIWSCERIPQGLSSSFFFFQAEDGIRDLTVTGVQTCALPISSARRCLTCQCSTSPPKPSCSRHVVPDRNILGFDKVFLSLRDGFVLVLGVLEEIGRASCRERV